MEKLVIPILALFVLFGACAYQASEVPSGSPVSAPPIMPESGPPAVTLESFDRLSFDLRGHRITPEEHPVIEQALTRGPEAGWIEYHRAVDQWLTKDALKRYVDTFLRFANVAVVDPDAETFFKRLETVKIGDAVVYHLPHTAGEAGEELPCSTEEIELVHVWWQDEPVAVCRDSYRPEAVFDEVGYCCGEAEPLMRQPPRPGCGCGPMLIGCLPPIGENPELDRRVRHDVKDEWFETAARIVAEDRPLDELVTTGRTWQSGLIEFLYLRREILGKLRDEPWTPEVDAWIRARISAIDIDAPGRWVDRPGFYQDTGIWWTSMAPHALKVPVRGVAHHLLTRHLGSDFHAVNVDADAVLRAVGSRNENLRTLSSITAAPMRSTPGCRGCHAPMDGVAGFLGEMQASMYGSFPTGVEPEGEFFVTGAEDFRGKDVGIAALAALVVSQPEFESTSVRRAFEEVLLRPVAYRDRQLIEALTAEFRENGHRWKPILKRLLTSNAYLNPGFSGDELADIRRPVPTVVAEVLDQTCKRCHDQKHFLNLEEAPPPQEVTVWKGILARVSDASMPPPSYGSEIGKRFPLDPSKRREFTRELTEMLGPNLDQVPPVRRLDTRGWLSIAESVASPLLSAEDIAALGSGLNERVVMRRLPRRSFIPPYQVEVERVSERICREVAEADADAGGSTFRIRAGTDWSGPEKVVSVTELLTRIHGRPPSPDELTEALELLDRFQEATGDGVESWVGLCSTCLSGPRIFFELFAEEATP